MFDKAVDLILKHEGGYVNDDRDPGGETNFGISKRAYPDVDIANLTIEDAKVIYKRDYWDKVMGDDLPQGLAVVVFDTAVNMGTRRAVKFLQGLVRASEDGEMGPKTLEAVLTYRHPERLLRDYSTKRIMFYASLPTFEVYGKGWVRRTLETYAVAL